MNILEYKSKVKNLESKLEKLIIDYSSEVSRNAKLEEYIEELEIKLDSLIYELEKTENDPIIKLGKELNLI